MRRREDIRNIAECCGAWNFAGLVGSVPGEGPRKSNRQEGTLVNLSKALNVWQIYFARTDSYDKSVEREPEADL